jgi:signal transduction histidine kinase
MNKPSSHYLPDLPALVNGVAGVPTIRRSAAHRYILGCLIAVAGIYLRTLLNPFLGNDAPLLLSIVAAAFAAWYGGFGPGVLATAIGVLGGIFLFVRPWGPHEALSAAQTIRLMLFFATGSTIAGLIEVLRRATNEWRRAEQEQENRVLQERNRMAREIHDTLAHGLTGIIVQLEAAEDTLHEDPDAAEGHIGRARDLARSSLAEARRSVQALRPQLLEHLDLPSALTRYVAQMTEGTGILARFVLEGAPRGLSPDAEDNLLRIALEAVTNALRHARAHEILVTLTFEATRVRLSVTDDGRGFVPHASATRAGFGLAGMWERAERIGGVFTLASRPGKGTEITVVIPLPEIAEVSSLNGVLKNSEAVRACKPG